MARPTLWDALPRFWRREAPAEPLASLVRLADDALGDRYDDTGQLLTLDDPLTCAARWLPELARAKGWTLDTTLPEALQRKIVALLVPLYREKGTAPGLLDAVRLFLGEEAYLRGERRQAWRLGRSHLGGLSFVYTATGGETAIDVTDARWRVTPHVGTLRAWRNGVELDRTAFLAVEPRRVELLTRGHTYTAYGGESALTLPFSYTVGIGTLVVTVDRLRVDAPAWSETSASTITFAAPLARGAVVRVWRRENPTGLTAGDRIELATTEVLTTALAASARGTTPADDAFALALVLPRALTSDERRALAQVIEVMRPSTMTVTLDDAAARHPSWRLGTSMLGRNTALG